MADAADVYLMEFEQLRNELVQRTNMAYAVVALDLTALGAGLTVFQTFPAIVVGLAVVASFLWLIYMDHASQTYKIAAYIALRLAPKLEGTAPGAMQWEHFLRELDEGDETAAAALYGPDYDRAPKHWIVSGGPGRYVATLFAASPPLLLVAFAVSSARGGDFLERILRGTVLLAALAVWVGSIIRFRHFRETIKVINAAISAKGQPSLDARKEALR
jgi:hypothetical protein